MDRGQNEDVAQIVEGRELGLVAEAQEADGVEPLRLRLGLDRRAQLTVADEQEIGRGGIAG